VRGLPIIGVGRAASGLLAGLLSVALAGCATSRVERAIGDIDGPGCCSCWIERNSPDYPVGDSSHCRDAAAAADERLCAIEIAASPVRWKSYEAMRVAHVACMGDKGWTRLWYLLITT
jgi:hypothetical protein